MGSRHVRDKLIFFLGVVSALWFQVGTYLNYTSSGFGSSLIGDESGYADQESPTWKDIIWQLQNPKFVHFSFDGLLCAFLLIEK